jgi:hypothetical protein
VLCAIEEHDRHDDNVSPLTGAEQEAAAQPPARSERPKTAGSSRADSARSGSRGSAEEVRAPWDYTAQEAEVDGPARRLPPDVVVSDRGQVSRESGVGSPEEALGDLGAGRAVGIDGRPMTRAGSNSGALVPPRVGAAQGRGLQGRVLTLQLLSNWGDFDAIGLAGIEVVLADRSKLQVRPPPGVCGPRCARLA